MRCVLTSNPHVPHKQFLAKHKWFYRFFCRLFAYCYRHEWLNTFICWYFWVMWILLQFTEHLVLVEIPLKGKFRYALFARYPMELDSNLQNLKRNSNSSTLLAIKAAEEFPIVTYASVPLQCMVEFFWRICFFYEYTKDDQGRTEAKNFPSEIANQELRTIFIYIVR